MTLFLTLLSYLLAVPHMVGRQRKHLLVPAFFFLSPFPGTSFIRALVLCGVSLGAQLVNNLPTIHETRIWSLGWEDSLEEGMATHSSILNWRIPVDRGAWRVTVHVVSKSQTWPKWLSTYTGTCVIYILFFRFFSLLGYCKLLSTVPCVAQ